MCVNHCRRSKGVRGATSFSEGRWAVACHVAPHCHAFCNELEWTVAFIIWFALTDLKRTTDCFDVVKNVLSYGNFIGTVRNDVQISNFSLSEVLDIAEDEIPKHTHEDAHFLLVLQGLYISTAKNVEDYCSPGTLIFNPIGTTHRDRFHTRGGRFFTVSLKPQVLKRIQDPYDLSTQPTGFKSGSLPWLAARLYREFKEKDALSPLVFEGICLELLAHTVRRESQIQKEPPRWLKLAHELLQDRCLEPITVGEVATTVGIHPFHLTRTFRKFFNCSPAEFLRKCRIKRASLLLTDLRLSLAQVALASGFPDQSQFTKSFRSATGLTPGDYRKLFS
jgi:AraC family transcriptional regulator